MKHLFIAMALLMSAVVVSAGEPQYVSVHPYVIVLPSDNDVLLVRRIKVECSSPNIKDGLGDIYMSSKPFAEYGDDIEAEIRKWMTGGTPRYVLTHSEYEALTRYCRYRETAPRQKRKSIRDRFPAIMDALKALHHDDNKWLDDEADDARFVRIFDMLVMEPIYASESPKPAPPSVEVSASTSVTVSTSD